MRFPKSPTLLALSVTLEILAGEALTVKNEDLETAMEGFSSASTWGLGQTPASSTITGWQDVGGMDTAKDALQEALELPTKFAKLLAK